MSQFPSFEQILSEVHQGLGLARKAEKSRFINLDLNFDGHIQFAAMLTAEIFDALGLDHHAYRDASRNAEEFACFHKAVELRTWTFNATQRQVLWYLLAYTYVPALARYIAQWSLANAEAGAPALDTGMPGGKFWYLPYWDKEKNHVELPVSQVLDWLLDLLGATSLRSMQGKVGNKQTRMTDGENMIRTLHNWRSDTTPKSANMIARTFADDATLDFRGAFSPDLASHEDVQFQSALAFVRQKELDIPSRLCLELPMTEARLAPILAGSGAVEERRQFVKLLAERYAAPKMAVIRRRLQVARLAQDGYVRLLEFLCPDVGPDCTDPARNKLLQLIGLFCTVYNLTIEAWKRGGTDEEQDRYFSSRLAPWDKADLLLSIAPLPQANQKHEMLAMHLTAIFQTLEPESPLADLVPLSEGEATPIIERRIQFVQRLIDERTRLNRLSERVRVASPWRALQSEASYWVIMQFANQLDLSPKIRSLALERLRELAAADGQQAAVVLVELHWLMEASSARRHKVVQQKIDSLFDTAFGSPGYREWKAPLLRLSAKHRLSKNDWRGAKQDYDAALLACDERLFGPLRGDIAREAFAVTIGYAGLNLQNDQRYHREILAYREFPDGGPTFEEAAAECEEFLWSELYNPYPGEERTQGQAKLQYEALSKAFSLVQAADWDGLKAWLKAHKKDLNKNFKEARRNSVLLAWLKMLPLLHSGIRANIFTAIDILLETWPEQARIADYNGQTPLMLAADSADVRLVQRLLPLSDVNAQDHLGRTVLHAAALGRSAECVRLVLDRQPDVMDKFAGEEGNNALHTAVRVGVPESVRLIVEAFPSLLDQANGVGQSPVTLARDIHENYLKWKIDMKQHGRIAGTIDDFKRVIALFEPRSAS